MSAAQDQSAEGDAADLARPDNVSTKALTTLLADQQTLMADNIIGADTTARDERHQVNKTFFSASSTNLAGHEMRSEISQKCQPNPSPRRC